MNDNSEQNRSEPPTDFKLRRARREGQVPRGPELGFFSILAMATAFAWFAGGEMVNRLSHGMAYGLVTAGDGLVSTAAFPHTAHRIAAASAHLVTLFVGASFLVIVVFEFIQTGPVFSTKALKFDFGKLNPAKGLKRLFSNKIFFELFKAVFKLFVYFSIVLICSYAAMTSTLSADNAQSMALILGKHATSMMAIIMAAAGIMAVIDQVYSRKSFTKTMRMSRREIGREHKDREGDPRLRQKRKTLHREFSLNRKNLQGLRSADLLIVNPVHYAVALRYSPAEHDAPVVVSRGSHALARRMKTLAFVYGIPIIHDPALARGLYRHCQTGSEIPESFYMPVAAKYNSAKSKERKSLA